MEVTQDRVLRSHAAESPYLALRSKPDEQYHSVQSGETVIVVEDEGYFFVRVLIAQGKLGWLYREFLKRKDLPL